MSHPSIAPAGVQIDPREMFRLYLDGQHQPLTEQFLTVLNYFNGTTYLELDDTNRHGVIQFVKSFLTLFTQPDYVIPEQYVHGFVGYNELISNLVAMTPFRTTDGFLELLRYQPSNLAKILTLYSARNRVRFDRRQFFDVRVDRFGERAELALRPGTATTPARREQADQHATGTQEVPHVRDVGDVLVAGERRIGDDRVEQPDLGRAQRQEVVLHHLVALVAQDLRARRMVFDGEHLGTGGTGRVGQRAFAGRRFEDPSTGQVAGQGRHVGGD